MASQHLSRLLPTISRSCFKRAFNSQNSEKYQRLIPQQFVEREENEHGAISPSSPLHDIDTYMCQEMFHIELPKPRGPKFDNKSTSDDSTTSEDMSSSDLLELRLQLLQKQLQCSEEEVLTLFEKVPRLHDLRLLDKVIRNIDILLCLYEPRTVAGFIKVHPCHLVQIDSSQLQGLASGRRQDIWKLMCAADALVKGDDVSEVEFFASLLGSGPSDEGSDPNKDVKNSADEGSDPNKDAKNSADEGSDPNKDAKNSVSLDKGSAPNKDAKNSADEGSDPNKDAKNSADEGSDPNKDAKNSASRTLKLPLVFTSHMSYSNIKETVEFLLHEGVPKNFLQQYSEILMYSMKRLEHEVRYIKREFGELDAALLRCRIMETNAKGFKKSVNATAKLLGCPSSSFTSLQKKHLVSVYITDVEDSIEYLLRIGFSCEDIRSCVYIIGQKQEQIEAARREVLRTHNIDENDKQMLINAILYQIKTWVGFGS